MVSVIIPAYNCERYLRKAVESAVSQSCRYGLEILIIEDGSSDGTPKLSRELEKIYSNVKVIENPKNIGVARSRNRGIEQARGKYIAFLDSDDIWLPEKLDKQISLMEKKGADICYTSYSFIDSDGNPIRRTYNVPEHTGFNELLRENVIGLSTAIIRREIIGEIRMRGDYAHEDYVFWLELLRSGRKAVGLCDSLVKYRVSESNRSGDKRKAARNRWDVYRRFLGMGRIKALWNFCRYAVAGVWKHYFAC